jgi:hypothetical protein
MEQFKELQSGQVKHINISEILDTNWRKKCKKVHCAMATVVMAKRRNVDIDGCRVY